MIEIARVYIYIIYGIREVPLNFRAMTGLHKILNSFSAWAFIFVLEIRRTPILRTPNSLAKSLKNVLSSG